MLKEKVQIKCFVSHLIAQLLIQPQKSVDTTACKQCARNVLHLHQESYSISITRMHYIYIFT